MNIDDAIENLKHEIDCAPKEPPQNADEHWEYDNSVYLKTLDIALRSLEMQKKLAEFIGMDICEWVEDYDYEENNISEYEYEISVDDFLIDEVKEEVEEE